MNALGYSAEEVLRCTRELTTGDYEILQGLLESTRQAAAENRAETSDEETGMFHQQRPQLLESLRIGTLCPERNLSARVKTFPRGSDYAEIVHLVCEKHEYQIPLAEAVLALVDAAGWSVKISNTDFESSEGSVSLIDLNDNDTHLEGRIEVRRRTSFVRGKFRLQAIAA